MKNCMKIMGGGSRPVGYYVPKEIILGYTKKIKICLYIDYII